MQYVMKRKTVPHIYGYYNTFYQLFKVLNATFFTIPAFLLNFTILSNKNLPIFSVDVKRKNFPRTDSAAGLRAPPFYRRRSGEFAT